MKLFVGSIMFLGSFFTMAAGKHVEVRVAKNYEDRPVLVVQYSSQGFPIKMSYIDDSIDSQVNLTRRNNGLKAKKCQNVLYTYSGGKSFRGYKLSMIPVGKPKYFGHLAPFAESNPNRNGITFLVEKIYSHKNCAGKPLRILIVLVEEMPSGRLESIIKF